MFKRFGYPGGKPMKRANSAGCAEEIATVRIELVDTAPLIWREVEVNTSMTLNTLHTVIQSVMNWTAISGSSASASIGLGRPSTTIGVPNRSRMRAKRACAMC
jgi:Plasmid pRiA4b ORF-3-like protein